MAAEPGLGLQREPQMAQLIGATSVEGFIGPANEQPLLGQQEVMAVNAEVDIQTTSDATQSQQLQPYGQAARCEAARPPTGI